MRHLETYELFENVNQYLKLQRGQFGEVTDPWDFNIVNGQFGEGVYAFLYGDKKMKEYYTKNGENLYSFKVNKKYVKDLSKTNLDFWGVKEFVYHNSQYKVLILKHAGYNIPSSKQVLILDPEIIILENDKIR